jgi:hypothetical protein
MRFRKLRIAWSITWVIACLLLIALWVRSNGRSDSISLPTTGTTIINSYSGCLTIRGALRKAEYVWSSGWGRRATKMSSLPVQPTRSPQWRYSSDESGFIFGMPHWFALLLCCVATALCWLRWLFSLRTLLIAISVASVSLGVVALHSSGRECTR